ncbi:hypothetical protein BDV29DRAFT_160158 [Aspergillus leporis]|uniref:Uncharacterized protein n=1 Tax=Aspergillus leporis TaxID=41062 RepID=A0A5N5WQE1_9EURO|nr:hypothetical protein BDV29DRAFT_160158 [Aspergillus leporis]
MKPVLFFLLLFSPVCLGLPVTLGDGRSFLSADKNNWRDEDQSMTMGSGTLRAGGSYTRRIVSSTFSKEGSMVWNGGQSHHQRQQDQQPLHQQQLQLQDSEDSNDNTKNNNNNNHGTLLTTEETNQTRSTDAGYLRVLRATQLPTNFLWRYAHEIVVVGLILLVPVTLAVVEVIERVGVGAVRERGRGRGMVRRGRRGKGGRRKSGKMKKGDKKKSKIVILDIDVDVDVDVEGGWWCLR